MVRTDWMNAETTRKLSSRMHTAHLLTGWGCVLGVYTPWSYIPWSHPHHPPPPPVDRRNDTLLWKYFLAPNLRALKMTYYRNLTKSQPSLIGKNLSSFILESSSISDDADNRITVNVSFWSSSTKEGKLHCFASFSSCAWLLWIYTSSIWLNKSR